MPKRKITPIFAAVLLALLLLSTAHATDPKLERTIRNIDVALKNCDVDQYWDGSAIKPEATPQVIHSWLRSCDSNLTRALNLYNGLSPQERKNPDIQQSGIKERLQKSLAFAKAARGTQNVSKQDQQQMLESCRVFKDVRKNRQFSELEKLVPLLKNPAAQTTWAQKVETINGVKEAAVAAKQACSEHPEFKTLDDRICGRIFGAEGAGLWCEAAEKHMELLPKALSNYLMTSVENLEKHRMGIGTQSLEKKNGWLDKEGPVEYGTLLYFTEASQKEFLDKYGKLFEAVGSKGLDPALIEKVTKMRDTLREQVDRLAPTLSMPAHTGSSHYSQELAKKKIRRWHPNANIKSSVVVSNEYSIFKNSLGVPKYRDRGGYILFQIPGEKWCQLRSFVASEEYQGGGKFQPAGDVMINSVRFQTCK